VVEEAERLAGEGVREINLIAQDLTAYGRDLRPQSSLADLLRRLNAVDGLSWIRLLYCYPNFVSDALLEAIAGLPKVVKYLDIPLQHADDMVLRAMLRESSVDALHRLLERIRMHVPQIALRTSFIVGFPGETEQAFERLLDFVREQEFDRVGVFTYSREEGTRAYDLPGQVPEREKRRRRAKMMEAQAEISLRRNRSLIGKELPVLVEGQMAGRARRMRGRTPWQAPEIDGMVVLQGEAEPGEFASVRIRQALTYDLVGEIVNAG
jgi:ribosomal protein S12 methylthiotransferase